MNKFLAALAFVSASLSHGHLPVPYWSPFGVWICVCPSCDDPHHGCYV